MQIVFYIVYRFGFWVLFFFFVLFLLMSAENVNDSCVYAMSIFRKSVCY